jgi:hypothetical protein
MAQTHDGSAARRRKISLVMSYLHRILLRDAGIGLMREFTQKGELMGAA